MAGKTILSGDQLESMTHAQISEHLATKEGYTPLEAEQTATLVKDKQ